MTDKPNISDDSPLRAFIEQEPITTKKRKNKGSDAMMKRIEALRKERLMTVN
jgi:hypothetical protein